MKNNTLSFSFHFLHSVFQNLLFIVFDPSLGGGLSGVAISEGQRRPGPDQWFRSWEPSREPDTEHGNGPSGHSSV